MSVEPYYQDEFVTLYHGDALELLPTLPQSSVRLALTDPPYVIGAVSAGNMASKSGGWAVMGSSPCTRSRVPMILHYGIRGDDCGPHKILRVRRTITIEEEEVG